MVSIIVFPQSDTAIVGKWPVGPRIVTRASTINAKSRRVTFYGASGWGAVTVEMLIGTFSILPSKATETEGSGCERSGEHEDYWKELHCGICHTLLAGPNRG